MANAMKEIDRETAIALQEEARILFIKATSEKYVTPKRVRPDVGGKYGVWYENKDIFVAARFFDGGNGFVLGVFGGEHSGRVVLTFDDTAELLQEGSNGANSTLIGELAVPFAQDLIRSARRRFWPNEE